MNADDQASSTVGHRGYVLREVGLPKVLRGGNSAFQSSPSVSSAPALTASFSNSSVSGPGDAESAVEFGETHVSSNPRLVELQRLGVLGHRPDLAFIETVCVSGFDLDLHNEVGAGVAEMGKDFLRDVLEVQCDLVGAEGLDAVEPGLRGAKAISAGGFVFCSINPLDWSPRSAGG